MTDVDALDVVPFDRRWDRSAFSCGKADLDTWLITQAGQQERNNNTRTFLAVAADSTRVVGYYSTTTYRLDLDEAAVAFGVGKRRYPVPAVLLARLAVDDAWKGRGLGQRLLVHALRSIAGASLSIGFEVVVVHAIDAEAAAFYARFGFIPFADHDLHLFLPVTSVRATFAAIEGP